MKRTAAGKTTMPLVSSRMENSRGMYGSMHANRIHEKGSSSGTYGSTVSAQMIKGRDIRQYTSVIPEAAQVKRQLRRVGESISLRNVLLFLAGLAAAAAAVILLTFRFESAAIYGNTMYSQQQIEDMITKGRLGDNTFVMALKYHNRKVKDIPFIDRIDVDIVSPSTVRVNITESPADGMVQYNGRNVYFSEDGLITTVSDRLAESAVTVNGVVLTHSNTGKKVTALNQLGLDLSIQLLKILDKYEIRDKASAIDVDSKCFLTVHFGDVRVKLGRTLYDEKMYRIKALLPYLEDRAGVIDMSWTSDPQADIVLLPDETADLE